MFAQSHVVADAATYVEMGMPAYLDVRRDHAACADDDAFGQCGGFGNLGPRMDQRRGFQSAFYALLDEPPAHSRIADGYYIARVFRSAHGVHEFHRMTIDAVDQVTRLVNDMDYADAVAPQDLRQPCDFTPVAARTHDE